MFACQTVEVDTKPKVCRNTQYQRLSHTRFGEALNRDSPAELLDDHRALEPPDPIPNSEVKRRIADGSVGSPHVRVGHRQAPTAKPQISNGLGFFYDQKKSQTAAW